MLADRVAKTWTVQSRLRHRISFNRHDGRNTPRMIRINVILSVERWRLWGMCDFRASGIRVELSIVGLISPRARVSAARAMSNLLRMACSAEIFRFANFLGLQTPKGNLKETFRPNYFIHAASTQTLLSDREMNQFAGFQPQRFCHGTI